VTEIVIRPTRLSDVDNVVAMFAAVAGEGRWIGRELPLDEELVRQRTADSVDRPGHYSIVAELPATSTPAGADDDRAFGGLAGQLHLGVEPYGVAELGMLVARELRGRGIGRALLADAIAWAEAQPDVHKIALHVWPHNEAARGLYVAAGFEEEGYLRRHYRRRNGELWDAVVMGRPV
jgi:putative acetyltransferase